MWTRIKAMGGLPRFTAFLAFVLVVHGNRDALAQKTEDVEALQKQVMELYQKGKYFSSFIGFFPADDPEICISVVLDEPKHGYYGGKVAAPVFKAIAERAASYLNIRPDIPPAGTLAASQLKPVPGNGQTN